MSKLITVLRSVLVALTLIGPFPLSSSSAFAWDFGDSVKYPDEEWAGFDRYVAERLQKIRELIGRNSKCVVAVYGTSAENFKRSRSKYAEVPAALNEWLPKSVRCVADISIDANTVNEQSGCAVVLFDSDTGNYSRSRGVALPISKLHCNSGGFEELMKMKGRWGGMTMETVEQNLIPSSYVENYPDTEWKNALIYASSSKYAKWFHETNDGGKAFAESKTKKTPKRSH